MSWKDIAKKSSLVYSVNARIKSHKLKKASMRLAKFYDAKASQLGFEYNAHEAIAEFKIRHHSRNPAFKMDDNKKLNVFWVGSNQNQDESGFLQSLKRMTNVTVFKSHNGEYGSWDGQITVGVSATFEEVREFNSKALLEQILSVKNEKGIDLLFGQMWADRFTKECLLKIQAMGILIMNISMDDRLPENWSTYNDVQLGSIGLAAALDMVLTTSAETCLWYGAKGCPAIFWPLASDPGIFSPTIEVERDIDVLFIGNRYGVRGSIIKYLTKHGVKVECYGNGWANGYANAEQMASLSKRALIILGIGAIGHCEDVYTLKLRDFDAPMSGAMYITHRNPDLCELYLEGEEVEYYETPKEALSKINFYLKNRSDLERIARSGHLKALSRDTWDARIHSTFVQLGLF